MFKGKLARVILCLLITACFAVPLGVVIASNYVSFDSSDDEGTVYIGASSILGRPLREVCDLYAEQNPDVQLEMTLEYTDTLYANYENGSSYHVTMLDSAYVMSWLDEYVEASTCTDMYTHELALVTADGVEMELSCLADIAKYDVTVTVQEPGTEYGSTSVETMYHQLGVYTIQAFESEGLVTYDVTEEGVYENIEFDESIADNIEMVTSVPGAIACDVVEGTDEAGITYATLADTYGATVGYDIPSGSHEAATVQGALYTSDDAAANGIAADFLEFCVTDEEATDIFAKYGFELAG